MRLPVAAVACLSVLLECNLPLPSASAASTDTVQRVVDGDTLITEQAGRVRLIGLNAPETVSPAQKQGAPPGCYGPQASEYLKAVLPPNSRVRLETDVEAQETRGRVGVGGKRRDQDSHGRRGGGSAPSWTHGEACYRQ